MNYDDFLELVKNRRSFRRFKSDPVPKETLEKVLEAARLPPSAGNSQPWEFVVVQDVAKKKSITKSITSGRKKLREADFTAPILIIVCGDRRLEATYPAHLEGEILLRQSLAVSIYTLQLAAATFGLATAWGTMQTESRETQIRQLLGIPDVYTVDHIVPLGYPDEEKEKRDKTLRPVRERASLRRELNEIVHYERYDMKKFRSDEKVNEFIWSKTVTRIPPVK
ncbi:MAG: nitroreductase family protein [Deltaproteobacteria bacterium]|nr:nitroreductase family protein [Deltaproteobacteria bacterium]